MGVVDGWMDGKTAGGFSVVVTCRNSEVSDLSFDQLWDICVLR